MPTRRAFLAGGAGALVAGGLAEVVTRTASAAEHDDHGVVPFYGPHQAGITTPAQDRLHFAAFDITTDDRKQVADLFRAWTDAAARMTAARPAGPGGAVDGPPLAPPDDTGEALGLAASRLTITVGFGPSLFDKLGLADRPAPLRELPAFAGDALQPARSGGDIAIQACADDPQVAVHAVRNLARIGFGAAAVRWSQLGFGRTSTTSSSQSTPRNLFGFKDGTANIKAEDTAALGQHVWVGAEGPEWLRGGSYLVARRIRMHIETWDRTSLQEQEQVIGRSKGSGAPMGGSAEDDAVVLAKQPPRSHVRAAHPDVNGGIRILRRGYSFVDGSDDLGRLDAGLFFLAFCRDPERQFVPLQRRLAREDALSEYIEHTSSAVFACPPGARPGRPWGAGLLS